MRRTRDTGIRTSVLIPLDVDKMLNKGRVAYKKKFGHGLSRSALITVALRGFFHDGDWLTQIVKGSENGNER